MSFGVFAAVFVTGSTPRHHPNQALQVTTPDEGADGACNLDQMLLSRPVTCPQRKARPSPSAQAPRPYKSSFLQLFLDLKLPSMPLPSHLLPFALPSLPQSLSSLLLKVKQLGRVSKTEGGASLLPSLSCAAKDARSLAPSPLPPADATPCCSCSSCRRCCSCCYCRDPKVQRTSDARWFTWLLR